jgi:hypothetical protein
MIRLRTGLVLCIGMFLLAIVPAPPSRAIAMQGEGRRSTIGILPLEIAQIQRDADYTKSDHPYFNPTFGLIALGIGALLGLGWLLGADTASRLRGDPVPSRIRTRLDRLDSATLAVLASVRAAKSHRPEAELAAEKALYDRLATDIGEVLDKVRLDLLLNFVDEGYLVPALDELSARARSLSFELRRLAPVRSMVGDEKTGLPLGPGLLSRINRGWERVFSPESAKMTTIRQLNAMRWPAWSRIETARRGPA